VAISVALSGTALHSTANTNSYTVVANLTAGRRYYLFAACEGASAPTMTPSLAGETFTEVDQDTWAASSVRKIAMWTFVAAATDATADIVIGTSVNGSGLNGICVEVTGLDATTPHVASNVGHSSTTTSSQVATVTLPNAYGAAGNRPLAFFASRAVMTPTTSEGTVLGAGSRSTPTMSAVVTFQSATQDTTPTAVMAVSPDVQQYAAYGLELVEGSTNVDLTVADGTHIHAADAPTLTQVHLLVVADAAHVHAADTPTLVQGFTLVVSDGAHLHAADSPTLSQAHTLSVAGDDLAHTADSPTLTQAHTLTVGDAAHAHQADSPTLSQAHTLVVADADHLHEADSPTLQAAGELVVADGALDHAADNVTLTQQHSLVVADAAHAHTADSVLLAQLHQLTVAEAHHDHLGDGVSLTQLHLLAVSGAFHLHVADQVTFPGDYVPADPRRTSHPARIDRYGYPTATRTGPTADVDRYGYPQPSAREGYVPARS
jgi:hypothetical protein